MNQPTNMITTVKDDHEKEQEKQLKKLLESYTAVAKHRLGRTPTLDDLQKMLSPVEETQPEGQSAHPDAAKTPVSSEATPMKKDDPEAQPASPSDPRILHMKVYYGMDKNTKQPDENQILYYEDPVDNVYYDCKSKEWTADRPHFLDHLQQRPVKYEDRDLTSAIVHGVMDEHSFNDLDQKGMMGDLHKRLWELTGKLDGFNEELSKSDSSELEDLSPNDVIENDFPEEVEGGSQFGELYLPNGGQPEEEFPGDDVFSEMVQAAMAEAFVQGEDRIREIVREELEKFGLLRKNSL